MPTPRSAPLVALLGTLVIGCVATSAASTGSSEPPAALSGVAQPSPPAVAPPAPPVASQVEAAGPPAPGASSAPVSPSSSAPAPAAASLSAETKGEASYYSTNGKGSCSLNPPKNVYILAASKDVYQSVQACGACLEVKGEEGTAVVQVMDLCFTCPPNNLVINKPAFEAIVGKKGGKGPVTWRTVPCQVDGTVVIRVKESSTRDWTAVQIRDSKLPLKRVAMKRDGAGDWVELARSPDNYWAAAKGAGDGGFRLRITAANDQQIEESVEKGWKEGKVYPGAHQF